MDTDTLNCPNRKRHIQSAAFPNCASVRAVRERAAEDMGITYRQLADELGTSISRIHNTVNGLEFYECGGPISASRRVSGRSKPAASRRLTDEQVAQARLDVANGALLGPIAIKLSIDRSALSRAVHGQTYKHITDPPPVQARGYKRRAPVGAQE